jgi:hypothetical protein
VPPTRAPGRAAHDHADAPLVVPVGVANAGRCAARALIHAAHRARGPARGEARGEGEPLPVLRPRDATREAQLGPAELARDEACLEPRQRLECAIDAGEIAQLRRHPRALGGVVASRAPSRSQPRVATILPAMRASARRSGPDARARA